MRTLGACWRVRTTTALAVLPLFAGCRTVAMQDTGGGGDLEPIRSMLVELYESFSFGPGEEADWDGMRTLFAPGANFYSPIRAGRTPVGEDVEEFVQGFRDWVTGTPIGESGLREEITHWQIVRCGTIAHAFVTFDGVLPDGTPYSQGVDAIQLVLDGERWLLASFTSQYARAGAPLPERFVDPSFARGAD
ncbi:nuclear transport factor 2 family protein [Engelhardtia mirabilis]|uniref:SnoaL-like domain-containing protein n=1 Tax=Engelhardtia mirabilis TaxID=2528011 RepID=A0A518BDV1_9BACT|nr:hypothetical protein Pla133_02100 [Planctomycetes bacterium Pla133]QDU99472.1 hypothetical protein Pla86_02100 [Planctomycetes bacterium Pla86]